MSLLKTSAIVGSLTIVSRALGFIRDLLIAFLLGTDYVAEAFFVAQRLPNLFRALVAEGAFNNAFVPQFAGRLESEGKISAFLFAQNVYSLMSFCLLAISALAILTMPWLVTALAPGFLNDPATLNLTIELTRICFPFLAFVSLVAMLSGVLNSLGRFALPALAPVLMNITMLVVCFAVWRVQPNNSNGIAKFLAYGVTLSGVVQLVLLLWLAAKTGFKIVPGIPRLTPEVRKTFRTAVPGIISGGISQINLAVATALASGMTGGVAFLYYAERLFEFPLGVVGVTVGVVLLPTLTRKFRANDNVGVQYFLNRGLELSMFLTFPAAAALVVLGQSILHTVFEHGAFSPSDTLNVVPALAAFATSLPAFTVSKVMQPLFYARHDVKTPMYFAIGSAVSNVIASLILSHFYQYVGIAIATSIAAWLNAALLFWTAFNRGHYIVDTKLMKRFPAMVFSTGAMCAVLWLTSKYSLASLLLDPTATGYGVVELVLLIVTGIISYLFVAILTNAFAFRELLGATN